MDKKAQGLSINTIIIALIALTVLVVLILIFTGAMGNWLNNTNSCEPVKGTCKDSCFAGTEVQVSFNCKGEGMVCCAKLGTA
ncbi:hypothetical protein HYU11_00820 [Candidatus Woesearchaeota archaeon]|nr:hypothetical protein [Candidatus Woesearchaeota archaeon]